MNAQFTVIITTKNRPEFLREAIHSVIHQTTTQHIGVIVVDDGSALPVDQQIQESQRNLCKILRNEESIGVSASRNLGAAASASEWIIYLDDDDWLDETYIERLSHLIETAGSQVDFCWPSRTLVTDSGNATTRYAPSVKPGKSPTDPKMLSSLMDCGCSGMAFRGSTLKKIGGFDESLVMSEDRDLVFRLLAANHPGYPAREPRVFIRVHGGERLSTDNQTDSDQRVIHKNQAFLERHPLLAEKYIGRASKRLWKSGKHKEAIATIDLLCSIRPFSMKARKRQIGWRCSTLFKD